MNLAQAAEEAYVIIGAITVIPQDVLPYINHAITIHYQQDVAANEDIHLAVAACVKSVMRSYPKQLVDSIFGEIMQGREFRKEEITSKTNEIELQLTNHYVAGGGTPLPSRSGAPFPFHLFQENR